MEGGLREECKCVWVRNVSHMILCLRLQESQTCSAEKMFCYRNRFFCLMIHIMHLLRILLKYMYTLVLHCSISLGEGRERTGGVVIK